MAIWLLQDREAGEMMYLNADGPDEAHQKYVVEYADNAQNQVTIYELPDEIADWHEVICWSYGDHEE